MNYKTLIFLLTLAAGFIFPAFSNAATISVKPFGNLYSNATNIVEVVLDTEGDTVNVVEGNILVAGQGKNIITLNTGGSQLSLWTNKPSLSKDTISFTGGVPKGISGREIPLFKIVIRSGSEKNITFNFGQMFAYLNNGLGTKISLNEDAVTLPLTPNRTTGINTLQNLILEDHTPPESFTIDLGRDSAVYDGKLFISFNATDTESGILRYEVQEGAGPFVRSGSPYVLQDQLLKEQIVVRAIDLAGNMRTETLDQGTSTNSQYNYLIVTVIALILLGILFKYMFL